jgi:hypothetical protein
VEGRAAADDVMVIKQGQAKPARCRESVHAQEGCQRPVAWRSFWRRCRVEHRKRSIFETFPRVEVGKVGGSCRDLHSVGAAK